VLNAHPNVIFLWGHDHTDSDTYYDKVYTAGDTITAGTKAAPTDLKINFTYCAAGCMSDAEYGAGGAFVKGKGLVMAIDNSKVTFNYYGLDCKSLNITKTVDVAAGTPTTPVSPAPVTPTPDTTKHTVVLSSQSFTVDGVKKSFEAYNIDGSNYFKLRDIAFVLNGTGSQFSLTYDEAKKAISCTTAKAYTPDGSELVIGADKSASAVLSNQSLYIDGKLASLTAFNIGGNNFFKLRELGDALKFTVGYDEATKTGMITSTGAAATPSVSPAAKGDPIGKVYFYAVTDTDILKDTKGTQIVYYPINIYKGDTIADAITTLHKEAFGDEKGWGTEKNATYGDVLNKLWGVACGDIKYGGGIWTDFTAGKHADPATAAKDGMIIYLNSFTGTLYFRTGYFDKQYVELKAGDSLTLTFSRCSGDGTVKACTGQPVSIDGTAAGTTDTTTAKVTLKFDKAGKYVVTGAGKDSYGTAVCYVVVK
jgi:hypothetical protein